MESSKLQCSQLCTCIIGDEGGSPHAGSNWITQSALMACVCVFCIILFFVFVLCYCLDVSVVDYAVLFLVLLFLRERKQEVGWVRRWR